MSSYKPLFVTSTARSGSYLISMMMSANDRVMVASEPYLELFRSFRNAVVRNDAPEELARLMPPDAPLQDYYFLEERIRLMDVIQAGDLETSYDDDEWDSFRKRSAVRGALQCAELIPHLDRLRSGTYKEMFDRALDVIADVRNARERDWVGIKDAWTIEFFRPLARAYPEARFVIILRDPRAVIASMLAVTDVDPSQVAHPLSYARHWRKYVAFATEYAADPLLADRLHVVTHEEVLREPERSARNLCDFLEVPYQDRMLDTEGYWDFATGAVWTGNSSFETTTSGISIHRAERWRSRLEPKVRALVDFVCGPDMQLVGYEPLEAADAGWPTPEVLEALLAGHEAYANWRSDLGDPQLDYGAELFRRALLALDEPPLDSTLVRRSFLFGEVHTRLRKRHRAAASV